ncbi:MAG: CRISPR-associated endonuclease Cas2 [Campylobacterales bacterium]|nr:CRISPR-associated endonuclease Cas2 [Campylobacterales bacterium]
MLRFVVAYDIPNDRRRTKIGELLEAYGTRVQRSVFEISLENKTHFETLKARLMLMMVEEEDSVRFYSLCANCVQKSEALLDERGPFEGDAIYFF